MLETVLAGQSYSITIKATDASGSSSQTIVEVTVTPGPNIRPPYFDKLVYDVKVKLKAGHQKAPYPLLGE